MTRIVAILLLLWTQLFAIVAPGCLILCIHEDGREAIELVGRECCRAAHEADDVLPRDEGDGTPSVRAAADRCRDVPLQPEQVTSSRVTVRSEPAPDRGAAPAIAVCHEVREILAVVDTLPPPRPSLPDHVPRRRHVFVLRC